MGEAKKEPGFTFVSGHVALDLAGTLRHRRTSCEELLREPADVARWLVSAGVLDQEPEAGPEEFASAVGLREAVYALVLAKLDGEPLPAAPLGLVNEWAGRRGVRLRLLGSGEVRREGGAFEAFATIALGAIRLLGSEAVLRQCESAECTRVFLDRSRRGDRRWCAMAGCGNRDKVRAHRRRAAEQN